MALASNRVRLGTIRAVYCSTITHAVARPKIA